MAIKGPPKEPYINIKMSTNILYVLYRHYKDYKL